MKMKLVEAFSAWFFTLLGVMLLGGSVLVVPERAFAFGPSNCTDACCATWQPGLTCNVYDPHTAHCITACDDCQAGCGGDTGCELDCLTPPILIDCRAARCNVMPGRCAPVCGGEFCDLAPGTGTCTSTTAGCYCRG